MIENNILNQDDKSEAKNNKKGRLKGCLMGCLISIFIFVLFIGILIGGGYWFFMRMKQGNIPGESFLIERSSSAVDCGDSADCFEESIVNCEPAFGEAQFEETAVFYFEVLGKKENSCVIYFKIKELKQVPAQFESLPDFILKGLIEDLSMECLIPKSYYEKGTETAVGYALENTKDVCKGNLLDIINKMED